MNVSTSPINDTEERAGDVFVLFSGHNDRAVITLCRFFASYGLPFAIVCASQSDVIAKTDWSAKAVLSRIDRSLDIALFESALKAVQGVHGASARPIYCPTTEFMNHFVMQERIPLQQLGWKITLPKTDVYLALSSKVSSQNIVEQLIGVAAPAQLAWSDLRAPCVLKPRHNIDQGEVCYPRLCRTEQELKQELNDTNPTRWFAQRWIEGQSYYLCAYILADGRCAHFWQQNLIQQPNGRSIVLARTVPNPGLALDNFFSGLVELGYHGPLMMELICDESGCFHYVEINPRFWGPLQLALDACPDILCLFVLDAGVALDAESVKASIASGSLHWYAWQLGGQMAGCRHYPALSQVSRALGLPELLARWDVYARPDTQAIHGRY